MNLILIFRFRINESNFSQLNKIRMMQQVVLVQISADHVIIHVHHHHHDHICVGIVVIVVVVVIIVVVIVVVLTVDSGDDGVDSEHCGAHHVQHVEGVGFVKLT